MTNELDQLLFVFERHHDIELRDGYALAGILIFDVLKSECQADNPPQIVSETIMQLSKAAADGRMPLDAMVYCWRDGKDRPDEITDNAEVFRAWAHDRLAIGVRTVGGRVQ